MKTKHHSPLARRPSPLVPLGIALLAALALFPTAPRAPAQPWPWTIINTDRDYPPPNAYDLVVSGQYAYVASDGGGLRIYDISNPANPVAAGNAYDGCCALGVTLSGQYAYLANWPDGLRIYDISNPTNPVSITHTTPGALVRQVTVSGDYAYVANWTNGLVIYSVTNPASPVELNRIDHSEYPSGNMGVACATAVSGHYLYLANGQDGLRIYDITNSAQPVLIGHTNDVGEASQLAVSGNYVFLANWSDGLRIYDVSNPARPLNVGHVDDGGGAASVIVQGDYAYVANGSDGLRVYDVRNPASPVTVGQIYNSGSAQGVALSGEYAYLASYADGLRTYWIQRPPSVVTLPAVIAAFDPTLQGTVNPLGAEALAWFEWGTTTNYGSSMGLTNVGSSTSAVPVSAVLTGLVAHVTYHYQLVASNKFGLARGGDQTVTPPLFTEINAGLPGVLCGSAAWGDYDNDGRLDILLTGVTGPSWIAQVWRNTGSGFTNINAGLPGVRFSSVAWGDYDNDGDLDILLTGATAEYPNRYPITQVWRNTGSGFTNINAGLPGVTHERSGGGCALDSVAWGDYDNDGDLDILLTGDSSPSTVAQPIAQVWRNTGSGFTNINAGLPGVAAGSAAWGDYDNDGRLDILLTGNTGLNYIAQVWRNTGTGFVNINAWLLGVVSGSAAWGDFDNDGWLDILLTGNTGSGYIAQVWRNTGSGFVNVLAGLPGVNGSSAVWGDYDNDGRLDILLTGQTGPNLVAQVWRNTGSGFVNINAALPGVFVGSSVWGDYDNDGRLDILLTGYTDTGSSHFIAQVWRNNGPMGNTSPMAPTSLGASVVGRNVSLNWLAANDGQTPASGLSYNLRVGTTPGAADVVSPQAALDTGLRRLPSLGNAQHGLNALVRELPWGTYYWSVQAVDTAFVGSPFAAEGRFVVRLPEVVTLGVQNPAPTSVTLLGTVNPRENETRAWFEYGLTPNYGSATAPVNLGSGSNTVPLSIPCPGLLPWMTYYYRAVASSSVGRVEGTIAAFTLPGPSAVAPALSVLPDLVLPQGGSTSIVFTVSPTELVVRVRGNNPVLLPSSSLVLGGSGAIRNLTLVPAPDQSGSAQITVTASDGTRTASDTFNLTVTPPSGGPGAWLQLTQARAVPPQTFRFWIVDAGSGSTNYTLEYRPDVSPTNAWSNASNVVVTPLGAGLFQVDTVPPPGDTGFYRVKGLRLLMAGFDTSGLTAEEGAGTTGPVLVFNGIYTGTVNCIWSDEQGATWTNQVQVNGTTAVIPIPPSFLSDNSSKDPLKYLTLRLEAGTGFALGATTRSRVSIEENDEEWQGVLQTAYGTLGFELALVHAGGSLQGQIQSSGTGFFPTNGLAYLAFSENVFVAFARDIPVPALAGSPFFTGTSRLSLGLAAVNEPGQTNVSPTLVRGAATLFSVVSGRPYWDTEVSGTFILLRSPTPASTNDVPLYPAP